MKSKATTLQAARALEQLVQLVNRARAQLAELKVEFARDKSRVDAVQAFLFRHLRENYRKRDRLRLAVHYRQKFLDSFVRNNTEEVEQAEWEFKQARAQSERDYEEAAAAMERKRRWTTEEEARLARLWEKLVKLYYPDSFTHQTNQPETYHKLIAAINQATDAGDIETLHEIAEDRENFMLRQGWAKLDLGGVEEPAQWKQLHETLRKEIAAVTESLNALRASQDYEQCRLAEGKPAMLEELVAERARQLAAENAELESAAERLAMEIRRVGGNL